MVIKDYERNTNVISRYFVEGNPEFFFISVVDLTIAHSTKDTEEGLCQIVNDDAENQIESHR